MENKNWIQELTRYRVKVERDGKAVVDLPGILCLPALLAAPRAGIAGMIAAPLLGYNVHLESEDGKAVDLEAAVRDAAETAVKTAGDAARTIRDEIEQAWQAMSTADPEAEEPAEEPEEAAEEPEEETDTPPIRVNPDETERA